MNEMQEKLKANIHPEKTSLFVVASHSKAEQASIHPPRHVDFEIAYSAEMASPADYTLENLPPMLKKVAETLVDKLTRSHQISVYIPTTIETDQTSDTTRLVNDTLAFLGRLFGSAASSESRGTSSSEQAVSPSEAVHIVRSYATKTDLEKYLPDILEYLDRLKIELKQEAIALEVNQKLMLI
jgi:hypothetical protein